MRQLETHRMVQMLVAGVVLSAMSCSTSLAQFSFEKSASSKIGPEVVAAGFVDVRNVDVDGAFQQLAKLGVVHEEELVGYQEYISQWNQKFEALRKSSILSLNWVARVDDFSEGCPVFWAELKEGADHGKAKSSLRRLLSAMLGGRSFSMKSVDRMLVFAAKKSQVDWLLSNRPKRRLDPEIWKIPANTTASILIFGNQDARRVFREIGNHLPAPLNTLDGKEIADSIDWLAIHITANDQKNSLELLIDTTDEVAAKRIQQSAQQLINQVWSSSFQKWFWADSQGAPKNQEAIQSVFAAKRTGNQIRVSIDSQSDDFLKTAAIMKQTLNKLRVGSVRQVRLNRLRQLALAMLNYESACKCFPPRYKAGKADKPLLSWRVLILPFLGQNEFYQKFKLDEPWNSEHNLKLVSQMPEVFWDPDPSSTGNNLEGKTIFQVPVGDGFLFNDSQSTQFKDITDGSSNTLLIASVAHKHAVPWTQPADWEVDLKDATAKLRDQGRARVEVIRCDGSAEAISLDKSATFWRRFLMRADGEILPQLP